MTTDRDSFAGIIDVALTIGLLLSPLFLVVRAVMTPAWFTIGTAAGVVAVCAAIAALRIKGRQDQRRRAVLERRLEDVLRRAEALLHESGPRSTV